MSRIAEHRACLLKVHEQVIRMEDQIALDAANTQHKLDAISRNIDEAANSMMSIRSVGEQILTYVSNFPQEVRDLLRTIVQSNWQIYQLLLKIHEAPARPPTFVHTSNIRFTNALGEYRELPYEFFCQWEPFEGFLRAQFKGKPGEQKIQDGQFHIIDMNNDSRAVIRKEHWNRFVSEGSIMTMSMIIRHIQRQSEHCPRPDCQGTGLKQCSSSGIITWYVICMKGVSMTY